MYENESMLSPSMGALKKQINNRYLLVNVTAQRARAISLRAEDEDVMLENKPVTIALHEIADGEVAVLRDQDASRGADSFDTVNEADALWQNNGDAMHE